MPFHIKSNQTLPEKGGALPEVAGDLETLAAQQGVTPITDFHKLLGDFWPEEEDADEFLKTLREWRQESKPG